MSPGGGFRPRIPEQVPQSYCLSSYGSRRYSLLRTLSDIRSIESVISSTRLATYSRSLGTPNARRALHLYAWNAQVSGAFMLPQQLCEISIRNAVSEVLTTVYGASWPWDATFERSLPSPNIGFSMRHELLKTRQGVTPGNTNKLIPELKFAFWGKMFTKRFDGRLWQPHIRTSFAGLPVSRTPKECRLMISTEVEHIRSLRNRIAHHEPIFQRNLASDYTRMLTLIRWRCPKTADWLSQIENVTATLGARP